MVPGTAMNAEKNKRRLIRPVARHADAWRGGGEIPPPGMLEGIQVSWSQDKGAFRNMYRYMNNSGTQAQGSVPEGK